MISHTVEYALRAIVAIAHAGRLPCASQQIAHTTRVPAPYLSKVLLNLVRAGLVRSQRGPHGGFTLAVPADKLTIWDVVEAVEPIPRIRECPLGIESHLSLCPLHRRLDSALGSVESALRGTTIGQLLAESAGGVPLCELNGQPLDAGEPK
jgi:Rrf2 family protein